MRILIISRYPPFPGGRESFVFELVNQLAIDNNVLILTPDGNQLEGKNLEIKKYPGNYEDLKTIIQDYKPDIINSHTFYLSEDALLIALSLNIPFGITLHGDQFSIGDKQRQAIVSNIVKKSTFVISVSENGKSSLIKNVTEIDEQKIFIIRNGVNLKRFRKPDKEFSRKIRNNLDIDVDKFVVLTPTRIAPYKGINFLIDIIRENKRYFVDKNFLFLISIPDYDFSEEEKYQFLILKQRIIDLKIEGLVKFSFNKYQDMHKVYSIADLFVSPSEKEQFPISILEAMASRVPVIATRVGGVPELLSNEVDSVVVDYGDNSGMFQSIKTCFERDNSEYIKRAYYKVQNEFTLENVSNNYIGIYKKNINI